MIFISLILLILGIVSEVIFLNFLLKNLMFLTLSAHLLSGLLITSSVKLQLDQYVKNVDWRFYFFILLINISLPLFGVIISVFFMIIIYGIRKKFRKQVESYDSSINLREIKPIYAKYGAGGGLMHLMANDESTVQRTKALFALGKMKISNINQLMYGLLSDQADEIRLLAFNILDQQESFITEDINRILKLLKVTEPDTETFAKFEKDLALLYWELIYRRLILKELEESMLIKAQAYALSAIKILKSDGSLFALLGKIYTRLKQYKQAEEMFDQTTAFNIPPSQVFPYLAEIKFKQREYIATKQYLDHSDTLLDIELVAPVKRFWDSK